MVATLVRPRELATAILDRIVFGVSDQRAPIRAGPPGRKAIALSFDDGPSADNTQAILELLRESDSRATFFVVGERAAKQQGILAETMQDGHELGNHTHRHRHTVTLSRAELRAEIAEAQQLIVSFDPDAHFVRPPFGKDRRRITQVAEDLGLTTVAWSIDSGDARGYSTTRIVDSVLTRARPGAIVLFHDGGTHRPGTLEACTHVVPALREEGYALVTIRELLAIDREASTPPEVSSTAPRPSS